MDVFCFLFTDMILVTKVNRKSQDKDKVKVIKPPMRLDKVVVHNLRDGGECFPSTPALIGWNHCNLATAKTLSVSLFCIMLSTFEFFLKLWELLLNLTQVIPMSQAEAGLHLYPLSNELKKIKLVIQFF